jgi:hypothetical protein
MSLIENFNGNLSKWFSVPTSWYTTNGRLISNTDDSIIANLVLDHDFVATFLMNAGGNGVRRIKFIDSTTGYYNSLWIAFNDNGLEFMFIRNTGNGEYYETNWQYYSYNTGVDLLFEVDRVGNDWIAKINGTEILNMVDWFEQYTDQVALVSSVTNETQWDDLAITRPGEVDALITFQEGFTREMTAWTISDDDLYDFPVYNVLVPFYQGKMRADFGDVRFYDDNGNKLDYFKQKNSINGVTGRFTVKVPFIPANGFSTFVLEYGFPSRLTDGDPMSVYDNYDEVGDVSKYHNPVNCNISQEGSGIRITRN